MADLQKLFFDTKAPVSDKEILATARLHGSVKPFAGRELTGDILDQVKTAVLGEMERLIGEGVLREPPDWLAVVVRRRLHVAFGSSAVQHLSRELRASGDL